MVKSEVIDGLAGDLHVTAEQIVDVNIGTYGGDDYVLSTGKEVSAELISNNKLRIFDGVMVYGGIRDAVSVLSAVDWKMVLSASIVAGIVSILTSVAGIPEVEGE